MNNKISSILSLAIISSPVATPPPTGSVQLTQSVEVRTSSSRTSFRNMAGRLAEPTLLKPMGTYVGELQEKWQFPSDHLPIGMTFEQLHFASWNVLDDDTMEWVIEKNSQGLSRSQIAQEHIFIDGAQTTIRDKHVIDLILEMISDPTRPRSILNLQETNSLFIEELKSRLPREFGILVCEGEAIVFNQTQLQVTQENKVYGVFTDKPWRAIQDVTFLRMDNHQPLRVVNAHLPGDPEQPARFQFAQYLAATFDASKPTIAMGDMNFNEIEMSEAFKQPFPNEAPFSVLSPYCTNISPYLFTSKAIDHFIVYRGPNGSSVELNEANEVLLNLQGTVSLLHGESGSKPRAS